MEFIKTTAQFEKMIDNKIIGMPSLINSNINFFGKNNILLCDNNIELKDVELNFNGNNSLIYLSSPLKSFKSNIYNNSTLFIGKDTAIDEHCNININESQNVIIGDDSKFGRNIFITTSDDYGVYTTNNKERINYPQSVFIGDHVYLGHNSIISYGVLIGSGSIIDHNSVISSNLIIPSNTKTSGNPSKIIKEEIFFTNDPLGNYTSEDTINSKNYKSDVFIYNIHKNETLSMKNIDKILKELDINSRLEFIQKLFIKNKLKNRFAI